MVRVTSLICTANDCHNLPSAHPPHAGIVPHVLWHYLNSLSCAEGNLRFREKLIHCFISLHAAKSLQSYPTLCDPTDGSPPGSPSLEFSRQEHWSGFPFPSPMHESEKWKWSCSCPTLCDPMDCSLPGSSVHGIFQARIVEWVAVSFSKDSREIIIKLRLVCVQSQYLSSLN